MIKGVITGDLVNSTQIAAEWRQLVMDALNASVSDLSSLTPIKIETYRGDSFQITVDQLESVLTVAIAIRAKLRASTPDKSEGWDARLSIGIGDVSFESQNILTSDGEAFRLSGRAFDNIGKKRLCISTPCTELDSRLELVTRFADDVVSGWTPKQAAVVYRSLVFPKTQKELAEELKMTYQNFNYHWGVAKGQLILDYINYYKSLVTKLISN
ncbi:MAG: hypothetical protein Q4C30_09570 [Bacteroidia bacterium]|nr:hypothetical protein [Bacteroidia bacterium]